MKRILKISADITESDSIPDHYCVLIKHEEGDGMDSIQTLQQQMLLKNIFDNNDMSEKILRIIFRDIISKIKKRKKE